MTQTAIVVHGSPYDPQSLEQAMSLAQTLAKSALVPTAFRGKPADILLVMMGGRELGFSVVQSFRAFYTLNGKLGMYTDAMIGACVGKPVCKFFRLVESTDKISTYETLRDGHPEPVRMSFTIEQAKRAGLVKNATYQSHTEAMLRARCGAALARVVYPDLLAGVYDPNELREAAEREEGPRVVRGEYDQSAEVVAQASVVVPTPLPPGVAGPGATGKGTGDAPFAIEAEWRDESPEQVAALEEQRCKDAVFVNGSMKGQHMEAASLEYLQKAREHMQSVVDGGRKTMPNLMAISAMTYWIERKSIPAPAAEPVAEAAAADAQ